jgi:peptide/nickel transport system substrate-binding protein
MCLSRLKLPILPIFLLVLMLAACQSPPSPSHLHFGLASAPVSLDPRFATDATSVRINRLLYRALVDFDEQLHPVPDLATWQQLSLTHYRFHLGQAGRQFHNGSQLTATDVKATYDFILDVNQASPHRGSLTVIKEIKVIDPDTIDFLLHAPDTLFPGRLVVGIVPTTLIQNQHPFNKQPVGSGQFEFIQWPQSSQLTVKRRADGQIVEFLEVKDPVVRALKLVHGELELLQNDLSPELVNWLATHSHLKVTQAPGTTFTYLGFNLQDPLTGQRLIRQAIAYAINREEIIHYILNQTAHVANSFLFPPTHWAGYEDKNHYSYDPQQARALLAQAGFTQDKPLQLTYKTSSQPLRIRIATVIQQQLAAVGIDMVLQSYDWGTFYGDIKAGRFQLYTLSWVGIKMPDIFHYAFHSDAIPPAGANRGRLQNTKIDALIVQAEQAQSLVEQGQLYRGLQRRLFEELPYVPLWYEDHVLATHSQVTGYTLAADGNYDGLNMVKFAP